MKKNIVIVILVLVVGALSYYSYKQFNANKDLENKLNQSTKQDNTNVNENSNQEQNNQQNENNNQAQNNNQNTNTKVSDNNIIVPNEFSNIDLFIKAAEGIHDGTMYSFIKGTNNKLDEFAEIRLTLIASIEINKNYEKLTSVPDELKDISYPDVYMMKIDDFNNTYKKLFNKSLNINMEKVLEQSPTCPYAFKIDKSKNIIYLHHLENQCDNIYESREDDLYTKNYKYEQDDNYYYVYQYVGIYYRGDMQLNRFAKPSDDTTVAVSSFEGNEDKFDNILWKFDKNYNFISTEKIS